MTSLQGLAVAVGRRSRSELSRAWRLFLDLAVLAGAGGGRLKPREADLPLASAVSILPPLFLSHLEVLGLPVLVPAPKASEALSRPALLFLREIRTEGASSALGPPENVLSPLASDLERRGVEEGLPPRERGLCACLCGRVAPATAVAQPLSEHSSAS